MYYPSILVQQEGPVTRRLNLISYGLVGGSSHVLNRLVDQ